MLKRYYKTLHLDQVGPLLSRIADWHGRREAISVLLMLFPHKEEHQKEHSTRLSVEICGDRDPLDAIQLAQSALSYTRLLMFHRVTDSSSSTCPETAVRLETKGHASGAAILCKDINQQRSRGSTSYDLIVSVAGFCENNPKDKGLNEAVALYFAHVLGYPHDRWVQNQHTQHVEEVLRGQMNTHK
jgi:hypothetical protein